MPPSWLRPARTWPTGRDGRDARHRESLRARAGRGRVRRRGGRRPAAARRAERGRRRARARPARARRDPRGCREQAARRAPGRGGHAVVGVRLRPRARRGLQLPRAAVRRRDRPRRGLAARRTAAPRGRADRAAAAGAPRRGRPRRGGRRVRGCGRAGRRRAGRDPDGRPDLPAARPAVDVRALRVGQRVPGAAYGRPAHRRASTGSTAAPRARAASTAARWSATAPAPRRCSASTASSSTPATRCGRATGSPRWSPTPPSLVTTIDRLAEDLEIYASAEFGWVVLGEGHTRSSVLMPQKRNPYALDDGARRGRGAHRPRDRHVWRWPRARPRAATT